MKTEKIKKILMAVVLLVFGIALSAEAQMNQQFQNGKVDWENGFIYAKGRGGVNIDAMESAGQAEQEAIIQAHDNALAVLSRIVNGVNIDSDRLYEQSRAVDDIMRLQTKGFIQMAVPVDSLDVLQWITFKGQEQPKAERVLKMPMRGPTGLFAVAAAHYRRHPENIPQKPRFEIPEKTQSPEYTGVIVDCTGIGLEPCLFPMILTNDGENEVFSQRIVDMEISQNRNQGMVALVTSIETARSNKRAGKTPLIVKGIEAVGVRNGNVVVTQEDAIAIMAADVKSGILKAGQVVFVTN
jgi:hypothetical protein